MRAEPDVSTIAALIGDPTRAIMLSALLAGQDDCLGVGKAIPQHSDDLTS